jgi:hypothetical protein
MKIKFLFISLLYAGLTGRAQNIEKPNVILILKDDEGSIDLNYRNILKSNSPYL